MKKEIERLKNEIDYWSKHLELDKFNIEIAINDAQNRRMLLITILFGMSTIIQLIIEDLISRLKAISLIILIFILFWLWFENKDKKKIGFHNHSWMTRERMIRERFEKFGVSKDCLNLEFENIRNILENPKQKIRELLIKEYYSKSPVI